MAKVIKYNLFTRVNRGTEEEPKIEQVISPARIDCSTQAQFDANYPIAEKEAVPGTIEVTGEFDPEPEPTPIGDSAVWDELDAAYQEGYREGVDSV